MLIISQTAQAELKEIAVRIAENDLAAATRIIKELSNKFDLLESNPLLGRARHDLLVNLRSFPHKKYLIFYFPIQDGVEILRVVHSSRDVEQIFTDYFEDLDE